MLDEQLGQTIVTTDPNDMKKLGAPHATLSPPAKAMAIGTSRSW